MNDSDPPRKLGGKFAASLAAANLLLAIVLAARMAFFAGDGGDDLSAFGGLAIILLSMAGLAFALAGIQDPETRSVYSWIGLIGNGIPFAIGLLLLHYG